MYKLNWKSEKITLYFLTGNEGKDGYSANAAYEAPEQAQQAIKQLNRYNLDGSVLKVMEGVEGGRKGRGKGGTWGRGEGGGHTSTTSHQTAEPLQPGGWLCSLKVMKRGGRVGERREREEGGRDWVRGDWGRGELEEGIRGTTSHQAAEPLQLGCLCTQGNGGGCKGRGAKGVGREGTEGEEREKGTQAQQAKQLTNYNLDGFVLKVREGRGVLRKWQETIKQVGWIIKVEEGAWNGDE